MVGNQFVYLRREQLSPIVGETEPKFVEFQDSFNLNKVLRSRELENGTRMVILDDLHERWQSIPITNKMGKIASYKREKDVFQSEILLEKIDADRFIKLLTNDD